MSTYYVYGHPCSDELYHYGIPDMRHGVRRFQDEFGRLTDAGYERYYGHPRPTKNEKKLKDIIEKRSKSDKKTSKTKTIVKKYINYKKEEFKRRHPWLMDDEELRNNVTRLQLEKNMRDLEKNIRDVEINKKGSTFIGHLKSNLEKLSMTAAESFARTFYSKSGEFAAKKIFKVDEKKDEKKGDKKDDDD